MREIIILGTLAGKWKGRVPLCVQRDSDCLIDSNVMVQTQVSTHITGRSPHSKVKITDLGRGGSAE